ncbi:MAG: bifunctional alpha,alpha-trehalose-phosphate synthase (UDP-forming)/trehalose-phosphatase [Bacteroidetes bacterium]|nr:bifunctional alpha,alpha-trehalose-phosphate synthase (UDP-forming)/trehalose-phosphatase [Bacteroidota bacterium]MCW5894180.1 bifunctional alpha,alpha-trehalose-phosphate synthase (UDP-forming)/trehalose-phosphatase [Bacteroidota bacterium]
MKRESKHTHAQRLVMVSNRLPFRVATEGGKLQFRESAGGLVTGLSAFLDSLNSNSKDMREYLWIGWPGDTVDSSLHEKVKREALAKHRSFPVFLTEEEMSQFYFGFCNKTIWPLFHYFPSLTVYQESMWKQYVQVNETFCNSILEVLSENDVVWIHDYHLLLLPKMLKQKVPHVRVGFFLHIPFPSFEIFRLLPRTWRSEILEGLLGADLMGFHSYDYTQHYLQCVLRLLGHEHNMGQIYTPDLVSKADTFPMGIDFEKFALAASSEGVKQEAEKLRASIGPPRIILSVDRLDYSKGILNRLQGFETLLDKNAGLMGDVVLVMIVVPSRIGVDDYDLMKRQIEEFVGKINGKFGRVDWTPIIYQYRHVPFEHLVALYSVSDVCLVTPLRDGMNLVAKEYVASKTDGNGVLILSEMAGAAKELGEAIIINPSNHEEIAEAMQQALEMPPDEQQRRNTIMQDRIRRYNVTRWAHDFVQELLATQEVQERYCAKLLPPSARQSVINHYNLSRQRLVLLDYDGTLVQFVRHPALAKPKDELLNLLRRLAESSGSTVVIISGRDKATLQQWFGELPVGLVAEHGAWVKELNSEWNLLKNHSNEWKLRIHPILELYADRLPGARVEEKEYSLVWHYRGADPEQGLLLARELTDHLTTFTANTDLQVMRGHKVVEIRTAGVNKGTAAEHFLRKGEFDFILAGGDDWTDEDLFAVMPENAYSIKIGIGSTRARYNLRNPKEVLRLLEQFTKNMHESSVLTEDISSR